MTAHDSRTRLPRSPWMLVSVAALSVLATACGSDADPAEEPGRVGQQRAYAECMTKNGVTLPRPRQPDPASTPPTTNGGNPPPGTDPALWERARAACADLQPPLMRRGG